MHPSRFRAHGRRLDEQWMLPCAGSLALGGADSPPYIVYRTKWWGGTLPPHIGSGNALPAPTAWVEAALHDLRTGRRGATRESWPILVFLPTLTRPLPCLQGSPDGRIDFPPEECRRLHSGQGRGDGGRYPNHRRVRG